MRLAATKLSSIYQYRGLGNQLYDAAGVVPSLDLDFASTKALTDNASGQQRVTFTRASSGTFVGSDGLLKTATTNEARFDHNPTTGESLGLLVEEARTNSIRNNTMVGAVAGAPGTLPTNWQVSGAGTLTQQIVGVGVNNGINYIDIRFSGTTSTSQVGIRFETNSGAPGTNGQTFTYATWLARVAGSLTNIISISCNANLYDAGGAYITTPAFTGFDGTGNVASFTRRAGTLTIASATAAFIQPQIALTFVSGVAIDITLRIGLPQLEQGAFATSPILTTTAAATRSADVASITGTNFSSWYRQDEGTVYGEGSTFNTGASSCLASIDDNTTSNRIQIRRTTTASALRIVSSGGSIDVNFATGTALGLNKIAAGVAANDQRFASNGALVGSFTSITPMPTVTQAQIGSGPGATVFNGTIRRVTFWPQRLADTTLQQITQ